MRTELEKMTRLLVAGKNEQNRRKGDGEEDAIKASCNHVDPVLDNISVALPTPGWARLLTYTPKATLQSRVVPAARGFAFKPARGSNFRIVDLHGAQVVDLMAWCLPFSPKAEHFSASYTRYAIGGSAPPQTGECLYSNRDSKMFEVMEDKVKCHDMLFMACNPSFYEKLGKKGHRSCAANVAEAMNEQVLMAGEQSFKWSDVHDPFNVFQNTPYYSLKALECSRKDDWIEMKALMSTVVALSSCPYEDNGFNGGKVTDVGVVWEED